MVYEKIGKPEEKCSERWEQSWMGRKLEESLVVNNVEEIQGLVAIWVTLGMATSVTVRQEPERRELGVRRGGLER